MVLAGLQRPPFESLESVGLIFLSLKIAFLTALTSIKRIGDLQAFLISEMCFVFGPADSHIILRPGNVPKVPSTPFLRPGSVLVFACPLVCPCTELGTPQVGTLFGGSPVCSFHGVASLFGKSMSSLDRINF